MTGPRLDQEWMNAAIRFRRAEHAAKLAEDERTAAREELLALSGGVSAAGFGVTVTFQQRKGSIDFKKIVETLLPDVNAETYRKDGTVAAIVKIIEE